MCWFVHLYLYRFDRIKTCLNIFHLLMWYTTKKKAPDCGGILKYLHHSTSRLVMLPSALLLVAGTGTNACYVERLDRVGTWDGDTNDPQQVIQNTLCSNTLGQKAYTFFTNPPIQESSVFCIPQVIINTEWGAFGDNGCLDLSEPMQIKMSTTHWIWQTAVSLSHNLLKFCKIQR